MSYHFLKSVHMLAATATLAGFVVRAYWMMTQSENLRHKVTKIAPHVVDTVFLLSGIAMLFVLRIDVLAQAWILAKFVGLIFYVLLGTLALKRGSTRQIRITAFIAALALFAYIVGVAVVKSPASWLLVLAA